MVAEPKYFVVEEATSRGVLKHCIEFAPWQVLLVRSLTKESHHSITEAELSALKKDDGPVKVYPRNRSYLDNSKDKIPSQRSFVNVVNQGTPEFSGVLARLAKTFHFAQELECFIDKNASQSSKRGNYQSCYGYAGGQCCRTRDEAQIREDFGTAMPSLLTGTRDNVADMRLLSAIAEEMGMVSCNPDLRSQFPELAEMVDYIHQDLDPEVDIGLMTKAFLPLVKGSAIRAHVDSQNGTTEASGQVIIVSRLLVSRDGKPYRASLIGNQKKSLEDALARRRLSRDLCLGYTNYLQQLPRYRQPFTSVVDFCRHGAGMHGIFLSRNKETRQITSVALVSRASMDKNRFFLSAYSWALRQLREELPLHDFTLHDAVMLCMPLLYFCQMEPLIWAMTSGAIAANWTRRKDIVGGTFGLVFELVNARNQGINTGNGCTRRCQSFCYRAIKTKTIESILKTVVPLCEGSHRKPIAVDEPMDYYNLVKQVADAKRVVKTKGADIGLAIQHFVHVLSDAGILVAPGIHRYAITSLSNTNGGQHRQEMSLEKGVARLDQMKRVLTIQNQVILYLGGCYAEEFFLSVLENVACEKCRDEKEKGPRMGMDFVYPGQHFGYWIKNGNGQSMHRVVRPAMDGPEGTVTQKNISTREDHPPAMKFSSNGSHRVKPGRVETSLPEGEEGTDEQCLIRRKDIDAATFKRILCLFFPPKDNDERHQDFNARVLMEMEGLATLIARRKSVGKAFRAMDPKTVAWNKKAPFELPPPRPKAKARKIRATLRGKMLSSTDKPICREPPSDTPPQVTPTKNHKDIWEDIIEPISSNDDEEDESLFVGNPLGLDLEDTEDESGCLVLEDNSNEDCNGWWTRQATMMNEEPQQLPHDIEKDRVEDEEEADEAPIMDEEEQECNHMKETEALVEDSNGGKNAKRRVHEGLHPVVLDELEEPRTLDWSDYNLRLNSSKDEARDGGLEATVYRHRDEDEGRVAGYCFKSYTGSRALFESKEVAEHRVPTMLCHAWNALNSGLIAKGKTVMAKQLGRKNFTSWNWECPKWNQVLHASKLDLLSHVDFNRVGRCLVCDRIAECLMGRKSTRDVGTDKINCWGFESQKMALHFVCLCILLTTGSCQYYQQLHKQARNIHAKVKRLVGESPNQHDGDTFVVAMGDPNFSEVPHIYLIGHGGVPPRSHHVNQVDRSHDFCIVVPDHACHRKNYERAEAGRKKKARKSDGRGLYFRPLKPN